MNKVIETHSGITKKPGVIINELGVIGEISGDIASILDSEGLANFMSSQERLYYLLQEFQILASKIGSHKVCYFDVKNSYVKSNFEVDYINNALDSIFNSYPKFRTIYNEILDISTRLNIHEIIKESLYRDYLEDLVYNYMNIDEILISMKDLFIGPYMASDIHCALFKYKNIEECIFEFSKIKEAYLQLNILGLFPLEKIFLLFNSFGHIKHLNISGDICKELKIEYINPLFSKLNLKHINMSRLNFTNLSPLYLRKLFSCFNNSYAVSISGCNIGELDKEQLLSIFPNFSNVRYLNLSQNNLSGFNNEELKIIFSNLQNIRHICLNICGLPNMDITRFEIIFTNLKNLRYLYMTKNPFSKIQLDLIMKIHPNLIFKNNS